MTNKLNSDFWGPVSNFGIPIAAVADTQKEPQMYAFTWYLPVAKAEVRSITHHSRRLKFPVNHLLVRGLRVEVLHT